ncbi:RNA chaperone Hfq [Desulfurobacterium atlanticum]|uniref:RNA chaperone Hfq n=1 Tax=Desulfurobacterium atlanticum TaxID=240169 RepID=A0A238XMP5_9BACT|nr:RNA chaperone Hfq [Desulfurobacterium atlanticum]SNR59990.1 RNA chaperone Hfq [Desulfurobacterium atlanticum]
MKRYKTLEELQLELIDFLEEHGEFRGTIHEFMKTLDVKQEVIIPLLNSLKASGDINYEVNGEEIIIRPASFATVPPVLTPQQEEEINKKLAEGYKIVASSLLGGVQSRTLRNLINKRILIFFRNGSKIEGRLKGFDRFVLRVNSYMGKMLVYKHSITTILYKS